MYTPWLPICHPLLASIRLIPITASAEATSPHESKSPTPASSILRPGPPYPAHPSGSGGANSTDRAKSAGRSAGANPVAALPRIAGPYPPVLMCPLTINSVPDSA